MSIISRLVDKFDNDHTSSFSDLDAFSVESSWISTGSPSLDYNLRTFGFPTGIVEVRGESQSGKTTMSLMTMLQAQREYDSKVVLTILSSERRDNKIYAMQIGVNVKEILVHRVVTVEDVFNKIHNTIARATTALEEQLSDSVLEENVKMKKGSESHKEAIETAKKEFGRLRYVFIWDALGQTVSASELKKAKENAEKDETGMAAIAGAARALSSGLRSFMGLMDEEQVTLFVVNRPYDNADGGPGIKKSYGGKAIMLFPTMRLELARIEGVKIGDAEVGQITQVLTLKNDFDSPKQKFKVEIGYGLGFVLTGEDVEMGIEAGILEKFGQNGAVFKMGKKELKWKTRRELYALYEERSPLLFILIRKLIKISHDKVLTERKAKEEQWKNQ